MRGWEESVSDTSKVIYDYPFMNAFDFHEMCILIDARNFGEAS
jgi:hypothetical protein